MNTTGNGENIPTKTRAYDVMHQQPRFLKRRGHRVRWPKKGLFINGQSELQQPCIKFESFFLVGGRHTGTRYRYHTRTKEKETGCFNTFHVPSMYLHSKSYDQLQHTQPHTTNSRVHTRTTHHSFRFLRVFSDLHTCTCWSALFVTR